MSQPLKIYIDRLRGGKAEHIEVALPGSFLGPDEEDLRFNHFVQVHGEAYLTDAHLIIHLKGRTAVSMPCAVCNEPVEIELKIENFYHAQPLEEIPSGIYDCSEELREAFLIELPKIIECNQGNCPDRPKLAPYLRKPGSTPDKTNYFPFAQLEENQGE